MTAPEPVWTAPMLDRLQADLWDVDPDDPQPIDPDHIQRGDTVIAVDWRTIQFDVKAVTSLVIVSVDFDYCKAGRKWFLVHRPPPPGTTR